MRRRRHWRRRPPKHFGRRTAAFLILALLLGSCVYGYLDLLELVAVYGESRCRNLVTQLVLDAAAETKTAEKNKLAKENGKLFGQKKGAEKKGEDTADGVGGNNIDIRS